MDAVLDSRLTPADPAPVAVAVSGGGDSLALLLTVASWAARRGRPLIALTVDHRLRPQGADWARWCEARARRLGAVHRVLVWDGEKPATGLSAAARLARHRLLAEAARAAGAAVILMGHTADDRAEARLMRESGGFVPSPRVWSPSPVWPQGRDIFLCRPLLGASRAGLRAALQALGETWIEDPANTDPASARARARLALAAAPAVAAAPLPAPDAPAALDWASEGPAGDLTLPLAALLPGPGEDSAQAARRLGAALLCAAGADRPPRGPPLLRLLARLQAGEAVAATLAGARVESDGDRIRLVRDAGDSRRGAPPRILLPRDAPVVWDGRFELMAHIVGSAVGPLRGQAAGLPNPLRRALRCAPALARPALPLVAHADGALSLPSLVDDAAIEARALGLRRLNAALGAIVNEGAARRMAKGVHPS